ncbi:MAG: patatin-like phospholipase family protein, partial [Solirubrobacteraceae bacterium]
DPGAGAGRLRVAAVHRGSGRRVVFGAPGAPEAALADAVRASRAAPWHCAPVMIGGREYVDGGVWSPTNLDAAPAGTGTRVLCLCPTGSSDGPLALWIRAASRAAALLEAAALRGRGAHVQLLVPDAGSAAAIGRDPMAVEPLAAILAAGYAQGTGA